MEFNDKELNIILGALNCYADKDLPEELSKQTDFLREQIKKNIKRQ